jgi:PIN domain nuclease of toxin-antitoxin system
MNLLLDTHTLLWAYWGDSQLSSTATSLIIDPANTIHVSPASYWEIAIKMGLRKLTLTESFLDFVEHAIFDNGFQILPIVPAHVAALIDLPRISTHKDPFDRLLISQSVAELMPVVSSDTAFDSYPVTRLW